MSTALSLARVGEEVIVETIGEGMLRRRLLDLGLVPGTPVRVLRSSPLGDPRAYLVRGAVIALRKADASVVMVNGGGYVG